VWHIGRSLIAAACWVSGSLFAADSPRPSGDRPEQASAVNVVVFSAPRPMFLRLSVRIDRQDLNHFRQRFAENWFRRLDHDKHGVLTNAEVAKFQTAVREGGASGKLDSDPIDGAKTGAKTSLAEFRALIDKRLGPPLILVATRQPSAVGMTLFRQIDLNKDGILTLDELLRARHTLSRLDADDDETISIAELNAAQPRAKNEEVADIENLPIVIVTPATAERIAKRLVRAYSSEPASEGNSALGAGELGLSTEAIRPFDRNHGGRLTAPELAQLICEMPAPVEVSFQLFEQDRGTPCVSVVSASGASRLAMKQDSADSCALVTSGLELNFVAKRTRKATGDLRNYYALRFRLVDKDKNGYLDKSEFSALGLPQADFGAVDRNGDGQITAEELTDFLGNERPAVVNRVVLSVSDESRSLFDFLDTRPDGRLSPRELNAAANRLRELDRNHDGRITLPELVTRVSVEAEIGTPTEPMRSIRPAPMRDQRAPAVIPELGPEWFRRMDRNYDGDVSRREFIGPREVFDRLDRDHDGLLSPEEAADAK